MKFLTIFNKIKTSKFWVERSDQEQKNPILDKEQQQQNKNNLSVDEKQVVEITNSNN